MKKFASSFLLVLSLSTPMLIPEVQANPAVSQQKNAEAKPTEAAINKEAKTDALMKIEADRKKEAAINKEAKTDAAMKKRTEAPKPPSPAPVEPTKK